MPFKDPAKAKAWMDASKGRRNALARIRRAAHRDEINAHRRDLYAANRETIRAKKRAYVEAHREHVREKGRENYLKRKLLAPKPPEKPPKPSLKERQALYYAEHKDHLNEIRRAKYAANRDKMAAYMREWRESRKGLTNIQRELVCLGIIA